MKLDKYVEENLMNQAIMLSHLGVNELCWGFDNTLQILKRLVNANAIITGGDVLKSSNDVINYTYDSWYYNGNDSQESFNQANEYITNYCLQNGKDYYFTIIIK